MTTETRRFPIWTRVAALATGLVLLSAVATGISAAAPSKRDVERARERLHRIEGKLDRIQSELAATQNALNAAAERVERRQGRLEAVTAELVKTQAELDRTRARYDRIVARLNDRAVSAYMSGPATSLDFLLNASTVADLTDRLAYVDALAQADAELASQVANLKNRLSAAEARLERDQARQRRALDEARAQEQEVADLFAEQSALLGAQQMLLTGAEKTFRRTKESYEKWLAQQNAAAGAAVGGRVWNGGSLAPFDHLFDACPVASPRAYGDGFGAPRYGGGYHLHKGVDIVAPLGAEIYAPFDGHAYTSANSLGGNVVFVVGAQGTVYNAHLSQYSDSSNSAVSAGDVIGYVGSTGSSSTPHDHFEFHPGSMPGPWPVSAYGYSVIEDAINPYPLLIQTCG
jgi:murein DD-endopeptidase MepM/ murein hydrolase activator NlpD